MGAAGCRTRFHSLWNGAGTQLLRGREVVLHHASGTEGAAGNHFREPVRLSRCRLPRRASERKTAPGAGAIEDASGALENLQILHEIIIQSISSGLITTGLDGHITLVNNAAQKLLECAPGQLVATPVAKLFLDPLPNAESQQTHAEVRFDAANGFRKTLRVRVATLNLPEGGTLGYVYALDDLTEIRRLEREVRMQDRLAAVGRLAAAIAHEIRNPLTSIAGSVAMLSDAPALSPDERHLLQIVIRESDRLNNIITDFLAYSRGKQYQFKKVDLLPLLEDTLTLLEHRLTAENTGITVESN